MIDKLKKLGHKFLRHLSRDRHPTSFRGWTTHQNREWIAHTYLHGEGIEIGALHQPLSVSRDAHVKYVDRLSVEELRDHYKELKEYSLVPVDILDDGEQLTTLADSSQDFVIANHFLEHCQNPILAIENMLRVLRPQGVLYMAMPDKRGNDLDRLREITPLSHVLKDYREGPAWSKRQHYDEWVRYGWKLTDDVEIEKAIQFLMDIGYSIHFHAWCSSDILEMLLWLQRENHANFEMELLLSNQRFEIITVLRKTG
jgi:SAM-dependent methyltransferase